MQQWAASQLSAATVPASQTCDMHFEETAFASQLWHRFEGLSWQLSGPQRWCQQSLPLASYSVHHDHASTAVLFVMWLNDLTNYID